MVRVSVSVPVPGPPGNPVSMCQPYSHHTLKGLTLVITLRACLSMFPTYCTDRGEV